MRQPARVWRAIQRAGGVIVAIRYDRQAHLATALVELDGERAHAFGYELADALEKCARHLGIDTSDARRTA